MKTLHYSIIVILILSTSLYLKPIQADDANGVKIENIQTLPSSIIIGETFKISATLVNNSSKPIFVDYGSCEAPFSVTFDTHVLVNETHAICKLDILEQKLNPGEKTIATSPSLDLVYRAAENGTVNATITFPYKIWNQTIQSNSNEIVSEPFSFTIYGKTRAPTLSPSGNQAIIDVALAIPGLQKWSNDWQYDSMAFMTAKNQPGNWQYAIVYLKASSSSSIIPCDSNNDWSAMVMIDRTTMKVIQATYPTMESHNCNYTTGGGPGTSGGIIPEIDTPLKQFNSGITAKNVLCTSDFTLVIKAEDGSPACVKPDTANILRERGWAEPVTSGISPTNRTNIQNNDPFGITALVIYHPFLGCLSSGCPHNNFYLKINSNSTAYLTGYSICDGESCTKNNNLSILLPINTILKNPNYASIELPESLKWKDGDTVTIQLKVSSTANDETGLLVDLGSSTIVP